MGTMLPVKYVTIVQYIGSLRYVSYRSVYTNLRLSIAHYNVLELDCQMVSVWKVFGPISEDFHA